MKPTDETSMRTGLFSKRTYTLSLTLMVMCMLFLFSCEIEDDFGKPDDSSQMGTLLNTTQYPVDKLIWTDQNQIVMIGNGISVIDLSTKTSKQLNLNNFSYHYSNQSWVTGNILYYLDYTSTLSSVDITDGHQNFSLVDSIMENYQSHPASAAYFGFNKWDKYDLTNEPYLYLFDVATRKEKLITTGTPITFSPDGKNLLFSRHDPNTYLLLHYTYSIDTKAITPLQLTQPYGYVGPIKWTTVGILTYIQYNNKALVYNLTTNTTIGEWENILPPTLGIISHSGKKIMTYKEKCASSVSAYCTSYYKQYYSVVDVLNNSVTEVIYGHNIYAPQFAFSQDESRAVYNSGNGIYLIESLE